MSTKSIDQLLDLLIDALEERKTVRIVDESVATESADLPPLPPHSLIDPPYFEPIQLDETSPPKLESYERESPVLIESDEIVEADTVAEEVVSAEIAPIELAEHIPMIDNMPRTMVRLFIALLVVIAFANLQLFDITRLNALFASGNEGTTTVRFARDGMLLRGDSLKVYLMENNKRRWITTSEAFNAYGYRWGAVRHVGNDYLAQFEEGEPIYLALKCPSSSHVFALDVQGETQRVRRWISDIETFEQMGFRWGDIDQERCSFLRSLLNGKPFPEDVDRPIPNP